MNDSTGKFNLDLPSSLINSTTTKKPVIFLWLLSSNSDTQPTVPPVANKSSPMAYEFYLWSAFF